MKQVKRITVYVDRKEHQELRLRLLRKGQTISAWLRNKVEQYLLTGK